MTSDDPSFEQWCSEIDRIIEVAVGVGGYTTGFFMRRSLRILFDAGVSAADAAIEQMRPPREYRN